MYMSSMNSFEFMAAEIDIQVSHVNWDSILEYTKTTA
jgi:hypothetical protein